ncbi:phosphatase PAP2 family protein [uncultured Clostridium sp.]|jgi:undecaprenyl-diphosphatase|uniref:phosphatase PAP2 family protein n=1 Tax=uncultured Clostridium sp. TaxID=59620 RepID=UPI002615D20A|nr:phosphatase PAP2 family protein [uncultured Clostridium sp.]
MINLIQNFDASSMYAIQELHNPILNFIMIFFTKIGDLGAIWLLIGFIFFFFKKLRKVGILIYLSQLLNIIVITILKDLIQRPRPFLTLTNLHPLISLPTSYSFPSGHASSAFAGALIIAYMLKKWAIPAYITAILIAFSRVYVGVHYPSDIIIGSILGTISSVIIIVFYKKFLSKKHKIFL